MTDSGLVLGLSWIDLVILAAALGLGVWGWRLGVLRAAVALAAIVVGVVLAGVYHERVFVDLAIAEEPSGTMRASSFLVILALVTVGGYVLGTLLRGVASVLLLGLGGSLGGGAVWGVVRSLAGAGGGGGVGGGRSG